MELHVNQHLISFWRLWVNIPFCDVRIPDPNHSSFFQIIRRDAEFEKPRYEENGWLCVVNSSFRDSNEVLPELCLMVGLV